MFRTRNRLTFFRMPPIISAMNLFMSVKRVMRPAKAALVLWHRCVMSAMSAVSLIEVKP